MLSPLIRVALDAIRHCIKEETDGAILSLCLQVLLGFLHNRWHPEPVSLDDICRTLCEIVSGRFLEYGKPVKINPTI